jgi:hypothetical protein
LLDWPACVVAAELICRTVLDKHKLRNAALQGERRVFHWLRQSRLLSSIDREAESMTLAPDNIMPGMHVSILETVTRRTRQTDGGVQESKKYAGAGAVLQVIAVSHPFVLVRSRTPSLLASPAPFPIDIRRTRLTTLSDDYVRAAIASQPSPRPGEASEQSGSRFMPAPPMPFSWGAAMFPAQREGQAEGLEDADDADA